MKGKKIGILVPCYNEEEVLPTFYNRISSVIDAIQEYTFELLFVNDGSTDATLQTIISLRKIDKRISYIDLSRNFGKEIAMVAGIDYADADALIIMDADLQDPPELIKEMICYWEAGYKDISAKRRSRAGESFMKKWTSHCYYKLLQKLTNIPIQVDVGDFRLLDRQCVEALKLIRESQRYTKGMFNWIGFEKKEILFDRDARAAGATKWNYWKLINLAIDGVTSFTIAPLRMASFAGCGMALIALLYMFFVIIRTLLYGDPVAGYPSMISVILFIGGVQLFFLGIMGEYLGRIFNESKLRPLYFVKKYNGQTVIKQK